MARKGQVKPNDRPSPGPKGNTEGPVLPETSPNASGAGNSAPPPKPPEEKKGWWKSWGSDVTHGVLDVVGVIPVVGEPFNLIGAGVYVLEGDYVSAGLDLAAMWPAGGQAATVTKYGVKGGKAVVEQVEKKAAKEAEEQAAKQAEEAAAKRGGKNTDGGHVKKEPKSPREEYLGRTPGKDSRTGKEVQERMRKEGKLRDGRNGPEFKASDGEWYPLKDADMSHNTDAVKWWNETGREYGAKSKEVRDWMLDSRNYTLDHYSINRSAGAKIGETYLPPLK